MVKTASLYDNVYVIYDVIIWVQDGNCKKWLENFSIGAFYNITNYKCGPMPNVMVALPNTGGVLCSTPQSLADAHYLTAKMRKPLKFAGVPQTGKQISAASGPKFTILWAHVEDILLLNKFFSDCRYVP